MDNQDYKDHYHNFFKKNGGYDFLVSMELKYENCAGLCQTPLFYLTKSIDKGMPANECLRPALDDAVKNTIPLIELMELCGYIAFLSTPFAIPLAWDYVDPSLKEV